jgi:hypothetical protein
MATILLGENKNFFKLSPYWHTIFSRLLLVKIGFKGGIADSNEFLTFQISSKPT